MSTNNSNTVLVPSRLRSIFKRFRSSSSRPATTAASGTATTIDGNQMIHHVEATSSITKREPSLPPTPPVSLQTRSNEILDELTQQFAVSTHKMRAIVSHFVSEMQKGLQNEGETVAMIPTFVTGRPTGQEKGKYLALDLGGTYLRVCEVSLHGNRDFGIHQQKYKVPGALKLGEMTQLCDFIAECVNNFLSEQGHDDIDPEAPLQLGFTFSFPVFQTSINRGMLKQWTKGFSCKNAVDKDVVVMLQDAFSRKKVPVNIAAIVNDTVGTLMALGYRQPETAIGVILGTGTNACYYEKIDKIQKWSGGKTAFEDMVINTEWGMFDCERTVLPLTIHDCKVDRESINPRQQMFEKMISGMYLGEITRNCILHHVDRQMMFKGFSSTELNQPYTFETEYMSTIQADDSSDLAETRHILEDVLKLPGTTLDDRRTVKAIIELVGRRAARLSACGLAAVMELSDVFHSGCTIAIDGSLYEHYPGFDNTMMQALIELYGPEIEAKISFSLARDGSGLGAAIVAMIAHKAAQQQQHQAEEHDSSL